MKFGIYVPPFGEYADARVLAGLARDAEEAGWDGFFTWDHVAFDWITTPIVAYVKRHRKTGEPFDAVTTGFTPGDNPALAADRVALYLKTGATWWLENIIPSASAGICRAPGRLRPCASEFCKGFGISA